MRCNFLWFKLVFSQGWYQHLRMFGKPVLKLRNDWILTLCCAGAMLLLTIFFIHLDVTVA